jgi:hypothetical protein
MVAMYEMVLSFEGMQIEIVSVCADSVSRDEIFLVPKRKKIIVGLQCVNGGLIG